MEVLAPGWGWLAFVSLLALEAGAVLWLGLAWFSRAPRLVLRDDPTEAERQAFARELERRLKKNPHVRAAGLRATDEHFLEKALDVLDARAGEEIRNSAKRVFLGTALSQNGRLDALIVFVSLARMVWRVSGIYNQRPTPAELWSVYSTVSSATFISFSIEALDIPRTITESMNELLPAVTPAMAASSVPLMGPMMQQCTSAVIDGAANCLLAIRAGVVTRSAFRFAALGREEARRVMSMLCGHVDVCMANEEDAFSVFGLGPDRKAFLSGGFDLLTAAGLLIKNSVGVCGIVLLIAQAASPLILLIAFSLLLKVVGAVVQAAGENELYSLFSDLSSDTEYFIAGLLTVAFMYLLIIMLVINSANSFI